MEGEEIMWREELRKDPTAGHICQSKGIMAAAPKAAIGCCVWDAKYRKAARNPKKGQAALITFISIDYLGSKEKEERKEK